MNSTAPCFSLRSATSFTAYIFSGGHRVTQEKSSIHCSHFLVCPALSMANFQWHYAHSIIFCTLYVVTNVAADSCKKGVKSIVACRHGLVLWRGRQAKQTQNILHISQHRRLLKSTPILCTIKVPGKLRQWGSGVTISSIGLYWYIMTLGKLHSMLRIKVLYYELCYGLLILISKYLTMVILNYGITQGSFSKQQSQIYMN